MASQDIGDPPTPRVRQRDGLDRTERHCDVGSVHRAMDAVFSRDRVVLVPRVFKCAFDLGQTPKKASILLSLASTWAGHPAGKWRQRGGERALLSLGHDPLCRWEHPER